MQADEIRFLFAYDRWATRRLLGVLNGLDPALWARTHVVGERGLGSILVHHLGASQRWRIGFKTQGTDEGPEPARWPKVVWVRRGLSLLRISIERFHRG